MSNIAKPEMVRESRFIHLNTRLSILIDNLEMHNHKMCDIIDSVFGSQQPTEDVATKADDANAPKIDMLELLVNKLERAVVETCHNLDRLTDL